MLIECQLQINKILTKMGTFGDIVCDNENICVSIILNAVKYEVLLMMLPSFFCHHNIIVF